MGIFDSWFGLNNANGYQNNAGMKRQPKVSDFNEEFSMDTSFETQGRDIMLFSDKGVQIYNVPNMLKITYNGSLAANGAQEVYAVIGYGDNRNWEDTEYYPMQKNNQGTYELYTVRKRQGNVNVAFKDNVNNWDNNAGSNYTFYSTTEGSH